MRFLLTATLFFVCAAIGGPAFASDEKATGMTSDSSTEAYEQIDLKVKAQLQAIELHAIAAKAKIDADKADKELATLAPETSNSDVASWGLSAALSAEYFRHPYIDQASLNGNDKIVSIDKQYRITPALWAVGTWTRPTGSPNFGLGFFVGTKLLSQAGTALDGFSLGFQVAFKEQDPKDGKFKPAWHVGLGWLVHKTQNLAKGIQEGQSLPAQFADVKYQESTENSMLIMVSRELFGSSN